MELYNKRSNIHVIKILEGEEKDGEAEKVLISINKASFWKEVPWGSSHCSAAEMNPISIHEDAGSIPGLTQWVNDPALLWAVV